MCWGDSLTAGFGGGGVSYPGTLQTCLRDAGLDIPVVNMGVNGEDTWTILGRSGAEPYVLFRGVLIPAEPRPVPIELCGEGGSPVVPLVYGDRGMERVWIVSASSGDPYQGVHADHRMDKAGEADPAGEKNNVIVGNGRVSQTNETDSVNEAPQTDKMNPVNEVGENNAIGGSGRVSQANETDTTDAPFLSGKAGMAGIGIEGRLTLHTDRNYEDHYYFTRSTPGEPVFIPAGSTLDTQAHRAYRTYSPIVYMGENGFYSDSADLIRQYRILLRAYDSADGRFLVIGAHTGSAAGRLEMEKAMQTAFGSRYINLRKYMAEHGMEDAGLEPDPVDLRMMEKGYTPKSLLSDQAHFNSIGYELFGRLVARHL